MKQININAYKNFHKKEFEISAHSNEHISRILESTRTFYEIDILEFCKWLQPHCRYVLDVGANIGNHAIFWTAICDAKVHAFEPHFENFELLNKNISENGLSNCVEAHQVALGEMPGLASLKVLDPGNMGMVIVQPLENASLATDCEATVEVKTLDQCVQQLRPEYIDLIKIDTEGYESKVIRGGLEVLKEYQPFIWVEIWSEDSFLSIKAILESLGYVWFFRYRLSHNYFFSTVPPNLFVAKVKRKVKGLLANYINIGQKQARHD